MVKTEALRAVARRYCITTQSACGHKVHIGGSTSNLKSIENQKKKPKILRPDKGDGWVKKETIASSTDTLLRNHASHSRKNLWKA